EYLIQRYSGGGRPWQMVQPMVCNAASMAVKIVKTVGKRIQKTVQIDNSDSAAALKLLNISAVFIAFAQLKSLVWSERGKDLGVKTRFRKGTMMRKAIRGIVRRADHLDTKMTQQTAGRKFG